MPKSELPINTATRSPGPVLVSWPGFEILWLGPSAGCAGLEDGELDEDGVGLPSLVDGCLGAAGFAGACDMPPDGALGFGLVDD